VDRPGARPAFDEHEVRLRPPRREAGGGKPRAEEAALLAHLRDVCAERLDAALELGQRQRDRGRRHRIRAARRAQHGDHVGTPDGVAHAAAGQAPGLGEGAQHEDVGKVEHPTGKVLVRVLDVHVIRREAPDIGQCRHAPRRIVGRHDRHDARARVDPVEERIDGEIIVPPRHARQRAAREHCAAIEHVETGLGQEHRTAGLEEGAARAVDSFIRAGGHQQAVGRHANTRGERGFERRDVRIASQQLGVSVG